MKGGTLCTLGRYQEALPCFDHALAINPKDARTWGMKGAALLPLGRFEEAIQCCDRALEINPQDKNPQQLKQLILEEKRKTKSGTAATQQGLTAKEWSDKGAVLGKSGR
jgi:tetratricopeptide (TPR) repeat protein